MNDPTEPAYRTAFIAPIRTGFRIDMQQILASGFTSWLSIWDGGAERHGWVPETPASRSNRLMFDIDTRRGAGNLPWIAERAVEDDSPLMIGLTELAGEGAVESARMLLFDFGIAVFSAVLASHSPLDSDVGDALARTEADSSKLADPVAAWATAALRELRDLIPASAYVPEAAEDTLVNESPAGVPLWFHRLLICEKVAGDSEACERFLVDSTHVALGPVGEVWIGHGTSVAAPRGPGAGLADSAIHVLEVANAYYAGAHELGSVVLFRQQELARFRRMHKSRAMREQAYRIVEMHDELALFRTLVADQLLKFSLVDLRIWEATADQWRLEGLFHEIDRRRADLMEIHDQALQRLQADEASRLNWVVFGLTLISATQVLTALIDFVQQQGFQSPDTIRTAVVAGFVLALVVITWSTIRSGRSSLPRSTAVSAEPLRIREKLR